MRKVFAVLVGLAVLAMLAPQAGAVLSDVNQLPVGTYQAKYSDYSDLYVAPVTGGGAMTPLPFGSGAPPLGAENRAIFYTTSIQPNAGPPATWLPGIPTANQQVTGLFYNLSLAFVNPTFTGPNLTAVDLYYVQSARNPLPGTPAGFGGVIEIYVSTPTTFSADPGGVGNLVVPAGGMPAATANATLGLPTSGPNKWVQGAGGLAGRDTYVGSSAGTLWLSGVFVDWATLAPFSPTIAAQLAAVRLLSGNPALDPVFGEHLDLTTGTGSAVGDIFLMGGSFLPKVGRGDLGLGPFVDMTLLSDLATPEVTGAGTPGATLFPSAGTYGGAGYWPIDSQDPVTFKVIPEPATMTLLGLGLLGIGAARRRMRKS